MSHRCFPAWIIYLSSIIGLPSASGQTGTEVPAMAAYDQFMRTFLSKWQIPGGALAVSRNGQLLYARGFGLADREAGEEVRTVRVFGDCYRCNWWAPEKTAHAWYVGDGRIRKSRFVRATKVADKLVMEDLSKG